MGSRREIEQILADPSYRVAPVPSGASGLAWLRANVCRFVNGDAHARRRALVEDELRGLHPPALRADARRRAQLALAAGAASFDVMERLARAVPLATLGAALGIDERRLDAAVEDSVLVGARYLTGERGDDVDAAVERLTELLARRGAEQSAAAVAVLAQACEATAALIGNALVLMTERPELNGGVDRLLEETLLGAAPLRVMRRVSPDQEPIVLDLESAVGEQAPIADPQPLTFGSGLRPCPGETQAMALAAGVLDELTRRCTILADGIAYAVSPAFRLPARVELALL